METPSTIQVVQALPIKVILISFLLGAISGVWFFPPTPVVDVSQMDQDRIVWAVLNQLEDNQYNASRARFSVAEEKPWYHSLFTWE